MSKHNRVYFLPPDAAMPSGAMSSRKQKFSKINIKNNRLCFNEPSWAKYTSWLGTPGLRYYLTNLRMNIHWKKNKLKIR